MGRLDSVPLFDELADGYDDLLPFFSTFGRRLVDLINPPAGTEVESMDVVYDGLDGVRVVRS